VSGESDDEVVGSIVLEGLVRRFVVPGGVAVTAVDGVSARIDAGSVVALCGPSGSGKSTMLHLIGALERPDSGRVVVSGRDLGSLNPRGLAAHRRRVGVVFQRFNLLGALSVLDNVIAPVLPYKTTFDKVARAKELLDGLGLGGRESALPARLSGGQQQRVAIARAMINNPEVVLADEPTGSLDSQIGNEVVELLLGVRATHGVTVVIATHDPRVAARCDRMIGMLDGHVAQDEAVAERTDVRARLDALAARQI
jgi:putative ABC transport system ATP-binding protein